MGILRTKKKCQKKKIKNTVMERKIERLCYWMGHLHIFCKSLRMTMYSLGKGKYDSKPGTKIGYKHGSD